MKNIAKILVTLLGLFSLTSHAATFNPTITYDAANQEWLFSWSTAACNGSFSQFVNQTSQPWVLTVNNVAYNESRRVTFTTQTSSGVIVSGRNGVLTGASLGGQQSIVCGADTLTLPAAVVQPAPQNVTSVPTLSEWALITLSGVVFISTVIYSRRKAKPNNIV